MGKTFLSFLAIFCLFASSLCGKTCEDFKAKDLEQKLAFFQARQDALNLTIELINKLESNTRFSQADEIHFFGGTKNFYSSSLAFYRQNGYVEVENTKGKDIEITAKKALPPYSFFGEALRLNRNLFVSKYYDLPLISLVEYYITDSDLKPFAISTEDFVTVEILPRYPKAKKIRLEYFVAGKFFLEDIVVLNDNTFKAQKNFMQELSEKNPALQETLHSYILNDTQDEPKLVKFLEENPKIAAFVDIYTPAINYEKIDTFFDIQDKDEEIFAVLSSLGYLIDKPLYASSQYALKLWGIYRYVLSQEDYTIPFRYAELFFKRLKSSANYMQGQSEEHDIACLEKILGENPFGYTQDFYLQNKNAPDFEKQRAALIQKWEDFYCENYR